MVIERGYQDIEMLLEQFGQLFLENSSSNNLQNQIYCATNSCIEKIKPNVYQFVPWTDHGIYTEIMDVFSLFIFPNTNQNKILEIS